MSNSVTNNNKINMDFGSWPSAISAEQIASNSISIDEPKQTNHSIYYIERRPSDNGRCVIVQQTNNNTSDILPSPYSARSRVHEYGGGCYCVDNNQVFFINDSDQEIYCISNQQITQITNDKNSRYADFSYDKKYKRLIAVCETHHNGNVTNSIVTINVNTGEHRTLVEGNDFYASPKLNASATQLCWQTWNHPNMPWDGNELWLVNIDSSGNLSNHKHIAGSDNVSIFQPQWSPNDVLHYISDATQWWHLYRYIENESSNKIEQLSDGEIEFGLPQWVFAQSSYAFVSEEKIICCYQRNSIKQLAILSLTNKPLLTDIATNWQEFSGINAANDNVCFVAASSLSFPQLISATVNTETLSLNSNVVKSTCEKPLAAAYYSQAKVITFENRHKQIVFANYYAPKNPDYLANKGTTPPLIVISHGGPTGQASIALDARKQFWTSRGFALLDVNYSGSTGYGKQYRSRLDNNWGILDVTDCCDAALDTVKKGLANENQLIIRGSSAGGYTVLSALTFEQVFSAGASYYGISELTSLASDTHKFESRYLDRLVGPYPKDKQIYEMRSPINSAEKLNCPVIFFQGVEDKVVPKEQAETMFELLSAKGLAVAAQYFEGEQHGFRKAETIIQSLENELIFYKLIFKLDPDSDKSFRGDIQLSNF